MTRLDIRQLVAIKWRQENAETHVNEINSTFYDSRHHKQAHGSIPDVHFGNKLATEVQAQDATDHRSRHLQAASAKTQLL